MIPIDDDGNDNDWNGNDYDDNNNGHYNYNDFNAMIRMQLWLNDPGNMDKLLAIKNGQQQVNLIFIIFMMTRMIMMMIILI